MKELEYFDKGVNLQGAPLSRWGRIGELTSYRGEDALGRYQMLLGALVTATTNVTVERRAVRKADGTLVADQRILAMGGHGGGSQKMNFDSSQDATGVTTEHEQLRVGYCGQDVIIGVEYDGTQQPPVVNVYELGACTVIAGQARDAAMAAINQLNP